MCEICGKREPQTQNTDDTNIGMIEGYAQNIIDAIQAWREYHHCPSELDNGKGPLIAEIKDQVAYLADHLAAL